MSPPPGRLTALARDFPEWVKGGELDLAEEFGVSYPTVRRAMLAAPGQRG